MQDWHGEVTPFRARAPGALRVAGAPRSWPRAAFQLCRDHARLGDCRREGRETVAPDEKQHSESSLGGVS